MACSIWLHAAFDIIDRGYYTTPNRRDDSLVLFHDQGGFPIWLGHHQCVAVFIVFVRLDFQGGRTLPGLVERVTDADAKGGRHCGVDLGPTDDSVFNHESRAGKCAERHIVTVGVKILPG